MPLLSLKSVLLSRFTRAALLLAALLSTVPLSHAQVSAINGQIEGTVTDPTGAVVPNAAIGIENKDTGYSQKQTSNDSGFYRFTVLPLGTYEVTVTAAGFQPATRTNIVLQAGSAATVNVTVSVSGASTLVEVGDAAPVAEPSRTTVGFTLSANQVTNLPLVSRNPYNFILLQPNVAGRPNTEFGVPRKLNANGFNGRINYQIDGGNNTQSDRAGIRLIPFSNTFITEIESVSNGFAPEFGNTVGTVFNTVTRSGTNQLHGEGAYLLRRTDFSSRPKLLAPDRPAPETNVDSYFANAGGRIIQDKLFYFAGFEKVTRDLPQVVTISPATVSQLGLPANYANAIPFSQNVLFFLGKLDAQLSEKHRLTLRFSGHRNDSPYNNGGGLVSVSQTYNFVDRSYAGSLQVISTLTPTVVNELRVQVPYRLQQQLAFEATGTGPSITIPSLIQFGNSPQVGFVYKEVTPEIFDNVSVSRGNHTLKFGFSYRSIRDRNTQATATTYTFPTIAAYLAAANGTAPRGYNSFAQAFGQPSLTYNTTFATGFVQDNWKVRPNITLVYGLRYDIYDPPTANSSALYEPSRTFAKDKNNFAPRLGIAWDVANDQKTIVRASGGMFYDSPQTDIFRRTLLNTGAATPISLNLPPTNPLAPSFPNLFTTLPQELLRAQTVETLAPDFRNLYSVNANVSITRQLAANTAVTVGYLFTRGNRLPVYRNINLISTGQTLADGRPIYSDTARIDSRFNNILVAESVGQSVYHGGNVTLNRRLANRLEAFASYTWSHSIDDAPEQNNIDSGTTVFPSDPSNRRRDRGNSLTDRRHALNASAVWTPVVTGDGFWRYLVSHNQLSLQFTGISGDVFNVGSNQVLNRDATIPAAFQRPLYIGRNTYRGPATYELNARYTRQIPIRERVTLELIAESTNVLNHNNVTGVNSTALVNTAGVITTAPSFAPTASLDQRLIQLGARIRF